MKIVLMGGKGLIGSKLAPLLRAMGQEVVAASLRTGVNSVTGAGLAQALEGASVVVDVTNSPSFADDAVMSFFTASTKNLVDASAAAGVGHLVALSVVGCDRLPESGYMRAKVAQERIIRAGTVPYTIVRATQFFEFVQLIVDVATVGGTVLAPAAMFQPIASDDIAAELAGIVAGPPLEGPVELGGPVTYSMEVALRLFLESKGMQGGW